MDKVEMIRKPYNYKGWKTICMVWTEGPNKGQLVGVNGGPYNLLPKDAKTILQGSKPEGGYHLWDEVFGKVRLVNVVGINYRVVPTTKNDIKTIQKEPKQINGL